MFFFSTEAEILDSQGVKIIIALGHSGYDIDQIIAKKCPLVDIVIGAHTHSFLYSGLEPVTDHIDGPYPTVVEQDDGKKVIVVQAYTRTKYIGKINLTVSFKWLHIVNGPLFMVFFLSHCSLITMEIS